MVLGVSLFDALAEWMGQPACFTEYTGAPPPRAGASHPTIAPYGPFAVAGGSQVNLGVQNERDWDRFCRGVLRQPELATDPRFASNAARVANRAELHRVIERVFAALSSAEVIARLDAAGIANARMNTVPDFLNHAQLRSRGRWREVDTPAGPIHALLPPLIMPGAEPVMGAVPALGAHTESVLRWLGYEGEQIAALRASGAVG
jgi:crotonobetainyl-CoA:carnitine CoA-transferase CaiB-like acyl-CoA transferase